MALRKTVVAEHYCCYWRLALASDDVGARPRLTTLTLTVVAWTVFVMRRRRRMEVGFLPFCSWVVD